MLVHRSGPPAPKTLGAFAHPGALVNPAGKPGVPAGRFRWNTMSDVWTWSAGLYLLHGYPARSVQPTTDLVLRHKVDVDRGPSADLLASCRVRPVSFTHYHRLRDSYGRIRTVLTVGVTDRDSSGDLVTVGYFADLTRAEQTTADAAVRASMENHRCVHQAEGALMVAANLSGDTAHALLIEYAERYQIPVASVARRVLTVLARLDLSVPLLDQLNDDLEQS